MPGHLDHSPADILGYLLILFGLGVDPEGTGIQEYPVYVDNEPDSPDDCITVYNSISRQQGRTQVDREIQEMHGIKICVRSSVSATGYAKARTIAIFLDESQYQNVITFGSATYCIHSFTRTSDINSIGKDSRTPTKRSIHTFNGLLTMDQRQLGTGTYY